MAGQSHRQVGFFDFELLLGTQIVQRTVDLVHGRVLRVVFGIEQPLNATVLRELLPVVYLLKDVIHRNGHFSA